MNSTISLIVTSRCIALAVEENINFTNEKKELLLWHLKSVINLNHIQELIHVHTAKESSGKHSLMPTVIKLKFAYISNCPVSKCTSRELAHAKKCNPQSEQQHAIKEKRYFGLEQVVQWMNLLSLLLVDC